MQISRKYHVPYVITEHLSQLVFEKEFGPAPSDAWQIPLLREAYEQADLVIPVSEELVENIACYFPTTSSHSPTRVWACSTTNPLKQPIT